MKSHGLKFKKKWGNFHKWVLFIIIIAMTIYLEKTGFFEELIQLIGNFGVIGVFISGLFFAYSFTIASAIIMFVYFANSINPFIIAFNGALGTTAGNLIFFNFVKKDLPDEIEEIIKKTGIYKLKKSKFRWLIPGIAGLIIAAPIPDEIAVSLLAIEDFNHNLVMLFSFIFSFFGILFITLITTFF